MDTLTSPKNVSFMEPVTQSGLSSFYPQLNNLTLIYNASTDEVVSLISPEVPINPQLSAFMGTQLKVIAPELHNLFHSFNTPITSENQQGIAQHEYASLHITSTPLSNNSQVLVNIVIKHKSEDTNADTSFIYLVSKALEVAPHGITIADARLPGCPLIYCNNAFFQLTGYQPNEVLGRNCNFLQGDDIDQRGIAIIREALSQKGSCHTVLRNYKKRGELFWNELSLSPVINGDGDVTHYVGLQYDITDKMMVEGALKESEQRYRTLFETNTDGVAYYTAEGYCHDANETYCSMLGMTWHQLIDSSFDDITPDTWLEKDHQIKQQQITNKEHTVEYDKELKRRDGSLVPVHIRQSAHYDQDGAVIAFWLSVRDLSQERHTQQKLAQSKQLLTETGKLAKVGGWELSSNNQVLYTEESMYLLGLDANHGDLSTLTNSVIFDHSLILKQAIEVCRSSGSPLDLTLQSLQSNQERWFHIKGNVRSPGTKDCLIVGAIQDVTETKQAQNKLLEHEAHLHHLAHHDALTGLPNRLLFNDRVRHAIAKSKREGQTLSVLILDLDRFKNINDSLGHEIGDRFLINIAQRVNESMRESDTFARLGGDEFVILLENIHDSQEVTQVAQKLLSVIAKPVEVDDHQLHSTASIGISMYPEDGQTIDDLLRCADAAMYRVKEKGKNNFQFYTKEITHRAVELLTLENDMHHAIEKTHFEIHYQPQINLSDAKLIGFEALLRWKHPDKGMISPGDFVPLAEESGLILKLGEWVIMEACRQAKEWLDKGLDFGRVAVNLSAKQFHRSNIVKQVNTALATFQLPADHLELEITEGIAVENIEDTITTLKELKDIGVHLAIDDFGTGYSSLSYLKRFSIDKLKIDKSFVDDILTDTSDAAIATSTIALAHQMGLKVIAEGVETSEQAKFLKDSDCDEAQGYLYAKPLPQQEASSFIVSYSRQN